MIDMVLIPEERKPVLIGKSGNTKKMIEKKTSTRIKMADAVEIEGETLGVLTAKNIVKAIGRGFSPHHALILSSEEHQLYTIILSGTPKALKTIRARIIGRKGYTRRRIEEYTGAIVSVYGKTVSLIGTYDQVEKSREAVELLVNGKPHSYVYSVLARHYK